MDQKENRRIAQTRRLLQEGLLRLLEHEKLEQIRVTALCKEAGINRATFYNHYASPVELLREMEQQLADELFLRVHKSCLVNLRYICYIGVEIGRASCRERV